MNDCKRKKVMFFVQPGPGGAENVAATVSKFLDRKEFEVKFVGIGKKMGRLDLIVSEGDEISLLHIRNLWDFLTLKLVFLLRRERPDYVFCSTMHYNSRLIIASKIVGGIKPIIRNCNTMANLSIDKYLMCKWTYPYAQTIIAQQEEMAEEITQKIPKAAAKVITLHNPLNTKEIDEKLKAENPYGDDKTIKFLLVARTVQVKGHDVLLKAFNLVHKKNPNTSLYFVGRKEEQSPFTQSLFEYVNAENLSDCVHFIGFDDNPFKWMKYANCFVLPSRKEGLPNALIQAMYAGAPVVATESIPVIKRIVENGYNGYTVPVDDVQAMANAMEQALLLKDFSLKFSLARAEDFVKLFRQ